MPALKKCLPPPRFHPPPSPVSQKRLGPVPHSPVPQRPERLAHCRRRFMCLCATCAADAALLKPRLCPNQRHPVPVPVRALSVMQLAAGLRVLGCPVEHGAESADASATPEAREGLAARLMTAVSDHILCHAGTSPSG